MKFVLFSLFFLFVSFIQMNATPYVPSKIFENVDIIKGVPDNLPKNVKPEFYGDAKSDAACRGKVRLLWAPLGIGGTSVIKNRFVYRSGATEIFDCLGNKTEYLYDNDLITAIIIYDENDRPYRREDFYWTKVSDRSLVSCHTVSDGHGKIHNCQTYSYNPKGKITKETLYGNLSGKNDFQIVLSEDKVPLENGVESYSTTYDYAADNPEHLICQREDNGTQKIYRYDVSGRLKAKFICDKDAIRARHFYAYDDSGKLTRTTIDDANGYHVDDLSQVKHRWIEKNSYLKESKQLSTVEQLYLDPKDGSEKLFKFINVRADSSGVVTKETTDCRGNARTEILDALGRQKTVIESGGKRTDFDYDANGNLISMLQHDSEGDYHATFTYDLCERLVTRKEVFKNGSISQTTHGYDCSGNTLVLEDLYGNRTLCEYDIFNRLIKTTYPHGRNGGGQHHATEKMQYDIFHRVSTLEDDKGMKTVTRYNVRGKPIEITFPDGLKETFEYYLDGALAKYTANDGSVTKYENDFLARPLVVEKYDADGKLFDTSQYDYSTFQFLNHQINVEMNDKEMEKSALSQAQDSIASIYYSLKELTQTFYNRYSYNNYARAELEKVGLEGVGKTYLTLSGYYIDHMEKGEYGENDLNDKVRITAINGILNLRSTCIENIEALSKAHGNAKVHYVFYPTEGWTKDLIKAAMTKFGYVGPQVKLLAETWKNLIQEMGGTEGGGLIIHYAHSIGGTSTMVAKDLLTPEEQKMIRVITVGSSTVIPDGGFDSVINFVSLRDGVTQFTDPVGYFKGLLNLNNNTIMVGSPYGVPFIDHMLNQETYARIIDMLGEDFLNAHVPKQKQEVTK